MSSTVYRFAAFKLDPAARELWRDGKLLSVPPRVFDALTYLIEHRDRAIGRDELIDILWGRESIADQQVTQLIMRVRHVIGQSGDEEPQSIRTIYGYGYRWIGELDSAAESLPGEPDDPGSAAPGVAPALETRTPRSVRRPLRPAPPAVLVICGAVLLAGMAWHWSRHDPPAVESTGDRPQRVVAVLPVEIEPSEAGDAWMRLGLMDLVAERIRASGLAVPPSDSVVSALHAVGDLPEKQRLAALQETLAVDLLVMGKARRQVDTWTIELATTRADDQRRVAFEAVDIIPATNQAAHQLLAALGQVAPASSNRDDTLSELLQRSRAAILSLELDTARRILNQAPAGMRDTAEARIELAFVEYHAGHFRLAEAVVEELLADPGIRAQPQLYGEALLARAIIGQAPRADWTKAEVQFEDAVSVLEHAPPSRDLALALAARGLSRAYLNDFEVAVMDLGRARNLFEISGDRMGVARIHNYFGHLEALRGRLAEAAEQFQTSIEISESFGHVSWLVGGLTGLSGVQMRQLQWPAALVTTERLMQLSERLADPVRQHDIAVEHATVLTALGRHREAERVLVGLPDIDAGDTICKARVQAALAWQQQQPETALQVTHHAIEQRTAATMSLGDMVLMRQRAGIAAGGTNALAPPPLPGADEALPDPGNLLARAEWAAHRNDQRQAEQYFQQALSQAENQGSPAEIVLVASAYGYWLIEHGRITEATAMAGRVAAWATYDYDSALLQVVVFQASGQTMAWANALRQARQLAGERQIPPALLRSPEEINSEYFVPQFADIKGISKE